MSTLQLTTVVGNPRTPSRTRTAAQTLSEAIAAELGAEWSSERLIDLAATGSYEPHAAATPAQLSLLTSADIVVVATPVYKASFTGLLKLFFDRLPAAALDDTVVVPLTVAGSAPHRLLADQQLRPVLAELGARVPVPGLTLEERELPDLETIVAQWIQRNLRALSAAAYATQGVNA